MTHDNSMAVIEKFRALGGTRVADPRMPVIVLDHDIQNRTPDHLDRYAAIEAFAAEQGIDFYGAPGIHPCTALVAAAFHGQYRQFGRQHPAAHLH